MAKSNARVFSTQTVKLEEVGLSEDNGQFMGRYNTLFVDQFNDL